MSSCFRDFPWKKRCGSCSEKQPNSQKRVGKCGDVNALVLEAFGDEVALSRLPTLKIPYCLFVFIVFFRIKFFNASIFLHGDYMQDILK